MKTTENTIAEGEILNFSLASRALNLDPDEEQIEKYDELKTGGNFMYYIGLLVALGLAVGTVFLFVNGNWILGILGIVITLFVGMIARSLGKATLQKSIAYKSGLLIPAIVINTNPIQLIALADMSSEEGQEPIYGCRKITVSQLPNHNIAVDEQVPCVSLFGMAFKGYRRHFEPRPVCWGFKEQSVIKNSIDFINNDNEDLPSIYLNEWEMLYTLKSKMLNVETDEVVFFDSNLSPINL